MRTAAPVDVGQAHVHDDEVDLTGARRLHALGAGVGRHRLELLVQRQLLDQRVAQLGIVVDDQDLADVGHHGSRPSKNAAGCRLSRAQ
jgi:hypothetical protein